MRRWPAQQRDLSRWNELADREGFIVVYPRAGTRPAARLEHDRRARSAYIADLVDKLRGEYNIDPKRNYANGLPTEPG